MDSKKYTREEISQHHILHTAVFIVFLILLSLVSLMYQVHRWKRLRASQSRNNNKSSSVWKKHDKAQYQRQKSHVREIKASTMRSRKEMQERMEEEIEALRLFQVGLKEQVDMLRVACAAREEEKKSHDGVSTGRKCDNVGDVKALKKEQ